MSFFCHSTCCIPSNSQHCVGVATDAGWCLPLCSILQQDFLLLHLAAESYLRHWIHDHQSRKNWAMKQKLARAWSAEVVTQQIKTLACCFHHRNRGRSLKMRRLQLNKDCPHLLLCVVLCSTDVAKQSCQVQVSGLAGFFVFSTRDFISSVSWLRSAGKWRDGLSSYLMEYRYTKESTSTSQ